MRTQSNLLAHIGIDLMGSDTPPQLLLEGMLAFASQLDEHTHLVLFGTSALLEGVHPPRNCLLHPVEEFITMEDAPLSAIRKKRGASLCVGIRMLKEGRLQAFISAGNTGALMASAAIELPSLPGVKKPALMALMPTKLHEMAVLDIGATTQYDAEYLVQCALMGIAYQKSRGIATPRVGLLNIGAEAQKGTPELRRAHLLLSSLCAFVGNVEARSAFEGNIDVLVTDGFTGNVFLKTAEGIAATILEELDALALPLELRKKLNYKEHPGALLCGVDGIVMKCHGDAGPFSFTRSITTAVRLIQHNFLEKIKKELWQKNGE